tara:strand:- start:9626 stop:10855 length:1230 start_codon:yes stop_codon:yes gene_type:complete
MEPSVQIAYLVNTYPRASHSFIRREIAALERRGFCVHRFAMRSDRAALVDPADLAEDDRTEHILKRGVIGLLAPALGLLLTRPAQSRAALKLAIKCGRAGAGGSPGTGGVARHLVYLLEAACIARRCRALGITHLHAHFGTNSTTVALLAHQLGGPRYSFTVHGPEEFDAPRAYSLSEKIRRAAFTVAISQFGRSQLCRWAALPDWPRLHVVHCGIVPALFPEPAALPPGGPHLVAIGRLTEQKGFSLLAEAIALAAPHHPGLRLTLVGDGPLRPVLEETIAANDLGGVVTLAGWQDENGVRQALAAAHALILPSFAEGLPVVVMEAMAAGRPVIATYVAGVPELLEQGKSGWLVPAGDAAALARAIDDLAAATPEILAKMGRHARARVLQRHDIDREAAKLAALFTAR